MSISSPRNQILDIIKKELIGPDPIEWDGLLQENGEEVLVGDPPLTRYVAGILYPQKSYLEEIEEENPDIEEEVYETGDVEDLETEEVKNSFEYLEDAEELINLSNAFRPSAMSLTIAVEKNDAIDVKVSAGHYSSNKRIERQNNKTIPIHERFQITWNNQNEPLNLPEKRKTI